MKPFVLDRRDKVKIGAIVLLGLGVILAGEIVTDLVYLPVYALMAAAFLWQRYRVRGKKSR